MSIRSWLGYVSFLLSVIALLASCGVKKSLVHQPELIQYNDQISELEVKSDSFFTLDNGFLKKNRLGLWEMYLEGDALQLGLANASLSKTLIQKQERLFFSKVEELVPGGFQQWLLRKFLAWYNRKLYLHIPEEYKTEIYGVSRAAVSDYDYIAPKYLRSLYLHGAHDIGHALKDLALVGCTSFAVWGDQSKDGEVLIGRNFDFYAGDEFAKDKIIAFIKPDKGYKFASITWGGMIGVMSGMNEMGLTVTINAGKSTIPWLAKTPVSLLTREILQYASTIDEAIAIAEKREVFVSEAILIGSAKDKRAVSIEVSPDKFGVYEVENSGTLICSNHFQSKTYQFDKKNIKHQEESHSTYRYERMKSLLTQNEKINPTSAVNILRNKDGLDDKQIGYGNEKALNQLLAHHGVVFQPEQGKIWVSTHPYQLGEFVCYDLNTVFDMAEKRQFDKNFSSSELNIGPDQFKNSLDFKNYEGYRILRREIIEVIRSEEILDSEKLSELVALNPNYWEANFLVGKYYYTRGYLALAEQQFEKAMAKEVTTQQDVNNLKKYIKKIKRRRK